MSLYVKNPAKLERATLKVHVKFPRERECDRATILYFIFSRKKEARERGCRALLASGPRAEVIPDPALFPIYVCPRASARKLLVSRGLYLRHSRVVPGDRPATCVLKLLRWQPSSRLASCRSRSSFSPLRVSSHSRKGDINYDHQVSRR